MRRIAILTIMLLGSWTVFSLLAVRGAVDEAANDRAGGKEANPFANVPYVVTGGDGPAHGCYFAKCVPLDVERTRGTTKIYRAGVEVDQLLDSYDWYAPRQFRVGIWIGWVESAGKMAVMRMHDEPGEFGANRVELSFYLGGKLLKSYTVKDLLALGANPKPQEFAGVAGAKRAYLDYKVPGWGGRKPGEYAYSIVTDKLIYFDAQTGEVMGDSDK